jgi:ammonia channel protein AmtB
MADDHYFD